MPAVAIPTSHSPELISRLSRPMIQMVAVVVGVVIVVEKDAGDQAPAQEAAAAVPDRTAT